MKRFLGFILVCCFVFGYSQGHRFLYEYRFVPDSTQKSVVQTEIMRLDILPKFSKFYSETVYVSDSLAKADYDKQTAMNGYFEEKPEMQKGSVKNIILKDFEKEKTYLISRIGTVKFKAEDNREIHWKIHPEKLTVGTFTAQKATAEMYGRKWTAWFAPDLPFQNGPYKFGQLPGLIVKLSDAQNYHIFELKGVRNLLPNEMLNISPSKNYIFDFGEDVLTDMAKYKSNYLNQRADPIKAIRAAVLENELESIEIDGKMQKATDYLREREKQLKSKIAKDNNILEIDLLRP